MTFKQPVPWEPVTPSDLTKLTGLSKARVSQLREALPTPDGAGSTEARPRWQLETLARWLAEQGRRLDERHAPWLLAGPDGPTLRRIWARNFDLTPGPEESWLGPDAPTTTVHVAAYHDSNSPRAVWLVTPIAPAETTNVFPGIGYHDGDMLAQLVDLLTRVGQPSSGWRRKLIGSLVLLPVDRAGTHNWGRRRDLDLRVIDVFEGWSRDDLAAQASGPQWRLDADLAKALGHRLPLWPAGCTTPDLVTAWTPEREDGIRCDLPPTMADADAFVRMCTAQAERLDGELAESMLALGRVYWHMDLAANRFGRAELPDGVDPQVWVVPLKVSIPKEPHADGVDFWPAALWTQTSEAVPPRLADMTLARFGDPESIGVVVLDPAELPAPVAEALTTPAEPTANRSRQARSVLAALDDHAEVTLDRWQTPGSPAWRTRTPEGLVAVHVPRRTPTEDEAGRPLDLTVVREPGLSGDAVGLITTDRGAVVMLPAKGSAARLASAVEHVVRNPGERVLTEALMPEASETLTDALNGALAAGAAAIPWRRIEGLLQHTAGDSAEEGTEVLASTT